ncbi:MAG: HAMP domain-containing histidine kinase [Oscillospiraceae bacterium]|nr:HAMP domain-containing histidine kinase [Oscillospiraceae bacterium]
MKGKNRYKKRGLKQIVLRWVCVFGIMAAVIHFIAAALLMNWKSGEAMFRNNTEVLTFKYFLSGIDEYNQDSLNELFQAYQEFGGHKQKGVERAAMLLTHDGEEIIASGNSDNRLAEKMYSEHSILSYDMMVDERSVPADSPNTVILLRQEDIKIADKDYRLLTAFSVNLFEYCFNYFLLTDVLLFVFAAVMITVMSNREYMRNCQDDYRRNIINSLSHDLKTPLTIISGCAENLKENVEPEKREYYENTIIENAAYTNKLINDALELTRSEDGLINPDIEKCSASEIVSEIWKKYDLNAASRGISLSMSGESILKGDRTGLAQMFENLISNAVKYTDDNGSVRINLSPSDIIIENDFSGKIDADIKKLTEPFVRGSKERAGMNGSGLGLSIAENIALHHRYKLKINHDVQNRKFKVNIKI